MHTQCKRILCEEEEVRALSVHDFISLAIAFISSLLLTSPHSWHMNPILSAYWDFRDAKIVTQSTQLLLTIILFSLSISIEVITYQNHGARSHHIRYSYIGNLLELHFLGYHQIGPLSSKMVLLTNKGTRGSKTKLTSWQKERKKKGGKGAKFSSTSLMQRRHLQVKRYCSFKTFWRVIVLPAVSI